MSFIVTALGDLAPGDSHTSYTAVYIIDGGHRLYGVCVTSSSSIMDISVCKTNSTRGSGTGVLV